MSESESLTSGTAAGLATAIILEGHSATGYLVDLGRGGDHVWCYALETGSRPIVYRAGDMALVCTDARTGMCVLLGRISTAPARPDAVADELVIEARKSLTLRVGDGSITIREDGKILIKGKDLVSHAKRMNRIRGGSVAIN
jgi:hypothetical protein